MNNETEKNYNGKLKEGHKYNPFNDISFWLLLASIDFTFGLAEKDEEVSPHSEEEKRI